MTEKEKKDEVKEEKNELELDPKDPFFKMDEDETPEAKKKSETKPLFLISTDSFSNAGLDMIFEISKEAGFDGVDLAIWKNYDARNTDYIKKISNNHNLPVKVIQVSENVNSKELNKALDLCEAT